MDWRVSPAGTSPCPPCSVFLPCLWGWEMVLSPPRVPLPRYSPSPSLPQDAKEGEGLGGQGSPSVLRLHRVFRLNQEIFYYQKEKRKKKNPSGHLSSLPHWDSRDWICGVSRKGGSGLEHSQARVVEFPVRPSARPTLGFSPLPPLLPLQANHQRWPSPDLRPLGWSLGGRGWGGGAAQP